MYILRVKTSSQTELVDITEKIGKMVQKSNLKGGICYVFAPHTTSGITINENAAPSVKEDILSELNKVIPFYGSYAHKEGNAAAHIKSTIIGSSESVPMQNGRLSLGIWQGGFFVRIRWSAHKGSFGSIDKR